MLYLIVVIKVPDCNAGHSDTTVDCLLPDHRPVNLHGFEARIRLQQHNLA